MRQQNCPQQIYLNNKMVQDNYVTVSMILIIFFFITLLSTNKIFNVTVSRTKKIPNNVHKIHDTTTSSRYCHNKNLKKNRVKKVYCS